MILLGICTKIENAAVMQKIGYDYIELGLSAIAAMTEEESAELKVKADKAPLPVLAANSMVPGDYYPLCGPEGTGEKIRDYLERAYARAGAMGIRIVVFGSGGARKRPEGMPESEALQGLAAFLRLAGPIAAKYGIQIAIEPLRAAECNIINHVAEAQELAALADVSNVKSLADLYHMMQDHEPYNAINNGTGVIHCHIAERINRLYPKAGDGSEADYRLFFDVLKAAGYSGGISVEGRCTDFEKDARASFRLLDELRNL